MLIPIKPMKIRIEETMACICEMFYPDSMRMCMRTLYRLRRLINLADRFYSSLVSYVELDDIGDSTCSDNEDLKDEDLSIMLLAYMNSVKRKCKNNIKAYSKESIQNFIYGEEMVPYLNRIFVELYYRSNNWDPLKSKFVEIDTYLSQKCVELRNSENIKVCISQIKKDLIKFDREIGNIIETKHNLSYRELKYYLRQ